MQIEALTSEQRERLLMRLRDTFDELSAQVTSVHERSAPVQLDQQAVGRVSRIDAIQQQQMAQANEQQILYQLARIKHILATPEDYGYCKECEEPIGFARLNIHTTAEYCIECQSSKEQ